MGFTGGGSSSVIYVIVLTVLNTVGQAAENIGIIFWFQNLGPLNDAYATLLQTGMVYAVFFWLALAGYVFRYRKDGAQFLGKPVWFGWCVLVAHSRLRHCCGGGRIRNGPPDRCRPGAERAGIRRSSIVGGDDAPDICFGVGPVSQRRAQPVRDGVAVAHASGFVVFCYFVVLRVLGQPRAVRGDQATATENGVEVPPSPVFCVLAVPGEGCGGESCAARPRLAPCSPPAED